MKSNKKFIEKMKIEIRNRHKLIYKKIERLMASHPPYTKKELENLKVPKNFNF